MKIDRPALPFWFGSPGALGVEVAEGEVVVEAGFAEVGEAGFGEDALGGDVGGVGEADGVGEACVLPGVIECGAGGLGGVALAPGVRGEVVGEFEIGAFPGDGDEAAVADDFVGFAKCDGPEGGAVREERFGAALDGALDLLEGVGLAVADVLHGEWVSEDGHERLCVGGDGRAEGEARGEDGGHEGVVGRGGVWVAGR